MKKHIIIDNDEGIFLGTAKNHDLEFAYRTAGDSRLVALFSHNNVLDITKAVGFRSKKDAEDYMRLYIWKKFPNAFTVVIEDPKEDTAYVDVIQIVKAGYGHHAWDMIDAIPMDNRSIH